MKYAKNTNVSVEKSRGEIESTLAKYGASKFAYMTDNSKAMIQFEADSRRIMFVLELPSKIDREFTHRTWGGKIREDKVSDSEAFDKWERACREKWRALALSIKSRLVSVESGIDTFEEAFMSRIIMPGGKTVGQHMRPAIEEAYKTGKFNAMQLEFK